MIRKFVAHQAHESPQLSVAFTLEMDTPYEKKGADTSERQLSRKSAKKILRSRWRNARRPGTDVCARKEKRKIPGGEGRGVWE